MQTTLMHKVSNRMLIASEHFLTESHKNKNFVFTQRSVGWKIKRNRGLTKGLTWIMCNIHPLFFGVFIAAMQHQP